jgi:hypothetical protein
MAIFHVVQNYTLLQQDRQRSSDHGSAMQAEMGRLQPQLMQSRRGSSAQRNGGRDAMTLMIDTAPAMAGSTMNIGGTANFLYFAGSLAVSSTVHMQDRMEEDDAENRMN